MNKKASYEHEHVEGFNKLANLEICVDMEATLQQAQTHQTPQNMIVKFPKVRFYSKRISSEALGTSDQQTDNKKMNITQSPQIVDLEEEEPKEQVNMDMVESGTRTIKFEEGSKIQSESNSRNFSSKKHIFYKKSGVAYQSKEDLETQYAEKSFPLQGLTPSFHPWPCFLSHHIVFPNTL